MTSNPTRWSAIAWAPYSRRSEMFARELDGPLHCIHYLKFRSPAHAPVKYPLQAVRTLQVLFRERPEAVHVQNPPFVCGLVVSLYCFLTGASFVVEYHSAAFASRWRWALPFQKVLARRAAVNIVTSHHWAEIVESWGGRTLVMYDAFLDLPEGRPFVVEEGPSVAFLSTFAPDEPLETVLAAARALPDVNFYITGDTAKAPANVVEDAPSNVALTGFLDPAGEYLGLLRAADVAVVLTTRDHTLQLAGCESISVGTPIVTSDWPYLQELFGDAAVYVQHDPTSIAEGISQVLARRDDFVEAANRVRNSRRELWGKQMEELAALVEPPLRRAKPSTAPARTD